MCKEAQAIFLEMLAAGQPFEVKNLATGETTMVIPNASMVLSEAGLSVFASSAGQGGSLMRPLELNPCPHCGCHGQLKYTCKSGGYNRRYYVECSECWTETHKHYSKAEAIEEWNSLKPTHMTNFEAIEAMNSQELAALLACVQGVDHKSPEEWEEWLQQEAAYKGELL